jgi:hypothetical protein
MIDNAQTDVATIGVRLLTDASLAWFNAEIECDQALRAWFESTRNQAATTYLSYRAALDREEAAAHDLERLWQLYEPFADSMVSAFASVAE